MAPSGLHLLSIFMIGLSSAQWTENPQEKKFCTWKCLLFVLQWPGSFCANFDPSECTVPPNINDWTIHGLWPMSTGMCCSCWPIFPSDLKELDSQLGQLWPSLLKTQSCFHFWSNEWRKHGVCAACVEGMNSPYLYFQIILKLRAHYDIQGSLDSAGIKPSCNQTYKYDQIYGVLAPILGDHVMIQCMQDDKGQELLVQVKILMSRNLTLGCDPHQDPHPQPHPPQLHITSPGHLCPKDTPLFYLPINHDHPHVPCG